MVEEESIGPQVWGISGETSFLDVIRTVLYKSDGVIEIVPSIKRESIILTSTIGRYNG